MCQATKIQEYSYSIVLFCAGTCFLIFESAHQHLNKRLHTSPDVFLFYRPKLVLLMLSTPSKLNLRRSDTVFDPGCSLIILYQIPSPIIVPSLRIATMLFMSLKNSIVKLLVVSAPGKDINNNNNNNMTKPI